MEFMPRKGQWVKFDTDLAPVHRAKDGKGVGIFHYEEIFDNGKLARAPVVFPVSGTGENIPLPTGGKFAISFGLVRGIEPVTSRDDIPAERLKNVPKNWEPRP